jgi:uncharacterized membrane protein YfhO
MNEFFDDAWKTTVDGANIRSLRVNGNQVGVPFTAGSHLIEFRYLPTIFLVSFGVSLFVVICLIYLIIARKFYRQEKQLQQCVL